MTDLSLAVVLAESARRYPDKVAVVDGDVRVTYAQLWEQARSYAAGLRELGVKPGDTVALVAPNVVEFPRAYYGALAAGAVVVPVHLLLTADEAAYVLRDSRADLVVCHTSQLAMGAEAAGKAGVPLVTVGPVPSGSAPARRLEDVAAGVAPLRSYLTRSAEDTAVVFYTSGTTGEPKGALLTHLNLVMNATVNAFDANDARPDDVALGCLPLFHTFGQTVSMNSTFRVGGTMVLLPRFTGDAAIELMLREGVDVFHGVPTMYVALVEAAARYERLPRLRLCISGGASLPVAVLEKFNAAFSTTLFEGYGLSETSPTASVNQPHFGTRPGTVGHPIWGVEVEVARAEVEERIELLPAGELGEIVIRGHNVFAGYLGRPEATEQAVVDGWFRTGDLGTKDDQGFISIVDRKKDLIIRGGFNVYPREVEEVIARHPAVGQVAVIGVPHEVHGEEICAVVVADGVTGDELIEWSRERLGRHKYPRVVRFVDQLPLGPSHKVLKRELRRSVTISEE
ncbi:long-chain-fatty-acid--CoA ligase [Planosporangium mesophilum]|uniref:AMP-dependent synthetase n=1 Tax=Planosporangium mesophilum TaxID=689768 RepID=A0A8J3TER6_9ACTN|nr:long-chain fatty acid--CoA ligase [Planosporangium mesophilum]NJC85065.1 long-chain fatty acid--CoA ligase [Planosporangium mesophilum]GII24482.1 AMP-dependent synthetase [Planosporangium mesophilum]